MKYKFKDSNYVINVRKNSSLHTKILKSNNDESEVARIVIDEYGRKSNDFDMLKLGFIQLTEWGLILTFSKNFGGIFQSDLYQNAVPFFIGFTALFASLGIYSHFSSVYYDKKYEELRKIRKEIEEKRIKNK